MASRQICRQSTLMLPARYFHAKEKRNRSSVWRDAGPVWKTLVVGSVGTLLYQ